jgi:beta-lactamase superfamily II metal-dependent hydrolase
MSGYDLIKMPQHGRMNRNLPQLIAAARPRHAIITSSYDRPPDDEVIWLLTNAGAEIFITPDGNVYCVSDGNAIIINQQKINGEQMDNDENAE